MWDDAISAYAQSPFFLDNPPHTGLSTVMPMFSCPADTRTLAQSTKSGPMVAFTAYLGVDGTDQLKKDGILFVDSSVRISDITDGTSNTIMVGERPPSAREDLGWWYAGWGQSKDGSGDMDLGAQELNLSYYLDCPPGPYVFGPGAISNDCDAFHFWSLHPGGANFAFADGSVHFMAYSAASIMPALATRAGGEVVSAPD